MTSLPPDEPTSPGPPGTAGNGMGANLGDTAAFRRFYQEDASRPERGRLYRLLVGWWWRAA
jgi:hypothetical protein